MSTPGKKTTRNGYPINGKVAVSFGLSAASENVTIQAIDEASLTTIVSLDVPAEKFVQMLAGLYASQLPAYVVEERWRHRIGREITVKRVDFDGLTDEARAARRSGDFDSLVMRDAAAAGVIDTEEEGVEWSVTSRGTGARIFERRWPS